MANLITSGVFNLGALGGDGATTTRPTRRWGGITGRGLMTSGTPGIYAWGDRIGSETSTPIGTVTDVTTAPNHKSFANGAYIDFSGGSTTADMRVQFRFRRDSSATGYMGVYTRDNSSSVRAGSLWTNGGKFLLYDTNGWGTAFYTPTNMYNTWFWIDVSHSGTSMTASVYDGGTEDTPGTLLGSKTGVINATGSYSTVRLMAGWPSNYYGNGDLGVVRINVGATDTNWTSEFQPYGVTAVPSSMKTTGVLSLAEHYQTKL